MSSSAEIFGLACAPLTISSFALEVLDFVASMVAFFSVFVYC